MANKSNVFFIPIDPLIGDQKISEKARMILHHMIDAEGLEFESFVPLKAHFGEDGNNTYIRPETYSGVIEFLESKNH